MLKVLKILREAFTGEEREYTSGSINRAIALLSIPMVLEMLMEGVFALVDAYWVSKISVDAVATVGLTETTLTLVYALSAGMSTAATAMVARRIGEHNPEGAANAAVQSTLLAIGVSLLVGIPGFVFAEDILRLMGAGEDLIARCSGYTKIMFGSNVVILLLFLFNAVLRGAGNAAYAMWVLVISNGFNLVLDPMLIFGWGPFPEMGIQGAAWATLTGRSIGVAIQLYLLLKGVGLVKIARRHLMLTWRTMLRLLEIAAGGAGQYIITSASWIFLMRIVSEFGSEAVAGYTIAIRIIVFTFLPIIGLGNAASTLVGQNLGARQPERAAASAWRTAHLTMLLLLLISIGLLIGAPWLLPVFSQDHEVFRIGVLSLRILSTDYFMLAYVIVLSHSFNGAGDTRTPTTVNLVFYWLLQIPLAYLLAFGLEWEVAGACWAVVISEVLAAVVMILLFKRGRWKLAKV